MHRSLTGFPPGETTPQVPSRPSTEGPLKKPPRPLDLTMTEAPAPTHTPTPPLPRLHHSQVMLVTV